jgi:hypothetical protein
MQENLGCLRKTLTGCLMIIIGIFICSVVSVAGIDVMCHNDIEHKLPFYPQAEIISQESGFFRPRAMGVSTVLLTSSDSAQDVRKWYSDYRLELEKQSYDERTGRRVAPGGLATVSFSVEENPDTGKTLITLMSDCAYN